MAFPQIGTPNDGPLTADELQAFIRANYPSTAPKQVPAGCGQCGRHPERKFGNVRRFPVIGKHLIDRDTPAYAETDPSDMAALDDFCAYGKDGMRPMPRIVPCSTLARWWLAIKRWLG